MDADLRSDEALATLRRLTGRIAGGDLELGEWRIRQRGVSNRRLAEFYLGIRTLLVKARQERARELVSAELRRDGASFETVRRFLVDVHPDVARDPRYLVELPERAEHISSTLIGELALALWHELLAAKSSVACRFCQRVRLFDDWRERAHCGETDCMRAYRQQWKQRHPELVRRERAKRSRARRARRGESRK